MNSAGADPEGSVVKAHAVAELALENLSSFFPSSEFLDGYVGRPSLDPSERLESVTQERKQLVQRHARQKDALLEEQRKEMQRTQAFLNGAADPDNFRHEARQPPESVAEARTLAPMNARNEVNLLWASHGRMLASVVEMQQKDLGRLKRLKENVQAEISSTEASLRSGNRFPASEWEFSLLADRIDPQHGIQVAQYLSSDDEAARKIIFNLACQSGRQWTEAATTPLKALYGESAEFRAKVLNVLQPKAVTAPPGGHTGSVIIS